MPLLLDGNNVLHALAGEGLDATRLALCNYLRETFANRDDVHVVFDGPSRGGPRAQDFIPHGIRLTYSGGTPADQLVIRAIEVDSAPRRLTVVSTDRQIRAAARRRRCASLTSEEFSERLRTEIERPSPAAPPEPPEKREGLSPEQTESWLEEFGIEPEE
jgi:hypothetical protein